MGAERRKATLIPGVELHVVPEYEQHRDLFRKGIWRPEFLEKQGHLFFPIAAKSKRVLAAKVTNNLKQPTKEKFIAVKFHANGQKLTKEYKRLQRAFAEGISVKPVGFMAELGGGPSTRYARGWLYTEVAQNSLSLKNINFNSMAEGELELFLTALGRTVAEWHVKHNFFHGDLAPRNILYSVKPGHILFHAVDLERSMFQPLSNRLRGKDLKKLSTGLKEIGVSNIGLKALHRGYLDYYQTHKPRA